MFNCACLAMLAKPQQTSLQRMWCAKKRKRETIKINDEKTRSFSSFHINNKLEAEAKMHKGSPAYIFSHRGTRSDLPKENQIDLKVPSSSCGRETFVIICLNPVVIRNQCPGV